jgi:hypothetical protein
MNVPYGYTSKPSLANSYQGMMPQHTQYGYAGKVTNSGSNMKVAMAAGAGLVGGLALGAGGYYAYYQMQQNNWFSDYNDNSWCKMDGQHMMRCFDCYKITGATCTPMNSCYGASGCSYTAPSDVYRDDIMNTGFYPKNYKFPLQVKITSITGTFSKAAVCPTQQPDTSTFDSAWQSASSFDVEFFMTLTEMDSMQVPSTASWCPRGQSLQPVILLLAALMAWRRIL